MSVRCPKCGNWGFFANQQVRIEVVVDGNGEFIDNIADHFIYDSGKPYGPFICTKCREQFDELPPVIENTVIVSEEESISPQKSSDGGVLPTDETN